MFRTVGDKVVGALPLSAEPVNLTSSPLLGLTCGSQVTITKKPKRPWTRMLNFVYLEMWLFDKTRERRDCCQIERYMCLLSDKTAEFTTFRMSGEENDCKCIYFHAKLNMLLL